MSSLVPTALRTANKGFPTLAALVGLFPSVRPLMNDEDVALTEGFPALLALIRLLPSVSSLVHDKV